MSRFDNGFVKIWRSIYSDDKQKNIFYGKGHAILVFQTLISWANYEDGKSALGRQKVVLKRGQVALANHELQKALGLTRQNIRSSLNWLKSTNQVTIESTNAGTIITIPDYDKFQSSENAGNQQGNQQGNQRLTNTQPTGNQRVTNTQPHIEEVKNIRKKEGKNQRSVNISPPKTGGTEDRLTKVMAKASAEDVALADQWLEWAKGKTPNTKYNRAGFIEAITKLRKSIKELYRFPSNQVFMEYVFEWIKQDDFWCDNALSPVSLTRKSHSDPNLRKFDQVLRVFTAEYRREETRQDGLQSFLDGTYQSPFK